jgi:hypothetical protein
VGVGSRGRNKAADDWKSTVVTVQSQRQGDACATGRKV